MEGKYRRQEEQKMQEKVSKMLESHPKKPQRAAELSERISEIAGCAITCNICADACLGEQNVQALAECIRLNLDCADICTTTAAVISRQTGTAMELIRAQIQACKAACKECGDECRKHAQKHEHCKVCSDVCQKCVQACDQLMQMV
jgi:hypothetical protein